MTRRAVITGVGAVTPLGVGAGALYDRWKAGECGIEDGAGRCADFDPGAHLGRKEARRSDRFTQMAMVACDEAIADAGWSDGLPYPSDRIGCVLGTGIGGIGTLEQQHLVLLEQGPGKVSPLAVPVLMANAATGMLALRHGLGGMSFAVVSACAAGAHAIGTATRAIEHGDIDACVTGGSEAALTRLPQVAFRAMEALSPTGTSRPFDRRRDGFVMGEGSGILVLEEESAARRRGVRPHARIIGYGASSDAFHLTAPDPEGRGAARAIERALGDAGVEPAAVDYVNAHGTSTQLNDRSETEALKTVLGEHAYRAPVSSAKSAIGHLLGAAGAVEAIATALTLENRVIPPTVGHEEPDDGLDLDYVPGRARPLEGRNGDAAVGLSNSFGFGGHNAVLCLAADRG